METDKCDDMHRLSDRVLSALNLALEQNDVDIADKLAQALELAMTRNAGGTGFEERRDYPDPVSKALGKLDQLKSA